MILYITPLTDYNNVKGGGQMDNQSHSNAEILLKRIEQCKAGNKNERSQLIQDYLPFIVKTASDHLRHYIEAENSDELTISMIAFDEAITKYDPEKGSFIQFAKRLIINRLIDYQRIGSKTSTLSYDDPDSSLKHQLASDENIENAVSDQSDLQTYENVLAKFGLSYDDLIESSPKHADTRKRAMTIGKRSSDEPPIVEKLYSSKRLPITLISTTLSVTIKIIKRSKALITSVIIAYVERIDTITEWIDATLKDD